MTKWLIQKPTKTNHSVPEKKASQVVGRTDKRHQFKGPLPAVQGIQKTKQQQQQQQQKTGHKTKKCKRYYYWTPSLFLYLSSKINNLLYSL